MRSQNLQVLDLHRAVALDPSDNSRHRVWVAGAVERCAGVVDVNAFKRSREAVGVALAPDLAVGDDVEPGLLLRPDREQGRVVLCLLEPRLGNSPKFLGAHARRESTGEFPAIDQPFGLWVTTDQRSGEQHEPSPLLILNPVVARAQPRYFDDLEASTVLAQTPKASSIEYALEERITEHISAQFFECHSWRITPTVLGDCKAVSRKGCP